MRKLLATTIAAVGAAALTFAPANAHHGHTQTYSYVAVAGDAIAFNCDGAIKVTETGVGGLCFDILRFDTSVTITFDDDSGVPVGGQLRFRDADGLAVAPDLWFCGTTGSLTIPAGASEILVWALQAKSQVTWSTATVPPTVTPRSCNPATTGTMTGTFV